MEPLTFDALTDVAVAVSRGRADLAQEVNQFRPRDLGPFIELAFRIKQWGLSLGSFPSLRDTMFGTALKRSSLRTDPIQESTQDQHVGLLRLDPSSGTGNDESFVAFGLGAKRAAMEAGVPNSAATSLVGAIAELRDNVVEHSEHVNTGVLGYFAAPSRFEFVVADAGVGVLGSLRRNSQYQEIANSGQALRTAISDGETRFGRQSGRGHGFRELFKGLQKMQGALHLKSGDHKLEYGGLSPTVGHLDLAEAPHFTGILISAVCYTRAAQSV